MPYWNIWTIKVDLTPIERFTFHFHNFIKYFISRFLFAGLVFRLSRECQILQALFPPYVSRRFKPSFSGPKYTWFRFHFPYNFLIRHMFYPRDSSARKHLCYQNCSLHLWGNCSTLNAIYYIWYRSSKSVLFFSTLIIFCKGISLFQRASRFRRLIFPPLLKLFQDIWILYLMDLGSFFF